MIANRYHAVRLLISLVTAAQPTIGGIAPARYLLSINPDRHGVPGSTVNYFASCVARSTVDSASQVPSYSRPVRVRRGV